MGKGKSSQRWLERQAKDPYVRKAGVEGARSRATYKLAEIDGRDRLIRPGMTIVDLGAAPGGWSEYASGRLQGNGRVIALDRLEMDTLPGVEFVHGDFEDETVLGTLKERLGGARVDLVLSDMAPNITGIRQVDQARSMAQCEDALAFAEEVLAGKGSFLVKVFQGEGSDAFRDTLRERFESVYVRKPKASRPRSREVYFLARNYCL